MTFKAPIRAPLRFHLTDYLPGTTEDSRYFTAAAKAIGDIPGTMYYRRGRPAIVCGVDCAWIVERELATWGLVAGRDFELAVPSIVTEAFARQDDLVWGQAQIEAIPELRDVVPGTDQSIWDWLKPFQRTWITRGIAWGGYHCHQSPGAGKSIEMLLWGLSAPGPLIVVTKAAVRGQFRGEFRRFTHLEPFVVWPADRAGTGFGDYLGSCGPTWEGGQIISWARRPVAIVGWTSLVRWVPSLLQMGPVSCVFDETHLGRASKREKWIPQRDGQGWDPRSLNNLSGSAFQLAKGVQRSMGGTATDVFDRLRNLWAQLTYVQPDGWGRTARKFYFRFCDAKPRENGPGIDTGGMSNVVELRGRLGFVAHRTPYSVSHAELPKKRRQVIYITQEELNRSGAFAEELRDAARAKDRKTEQEIRIAKAASRKRRYVIEFVLERLEAGQKILILDGRHKNVENLIRDVLKKWKDAVGPYNPPVVVNCKNAGIGAFDVYIGRMKSLPGGWEGPGADGEWGNRSGTIEAYEKTLRMKARDPKFAEKLRSLGGRRLGCFCAPGPCHGDAIARWWLADATARQNVFRADGSVPGAERQRIRELWMGSIDGSSDRPPFAGPGIVIGTYQAIGTGMNWHDTDVLAWTYLPPNPGAIWQGENRISRLGQIRPCLVVYFVAEGTYDERIVEILMPKIAQAEAVGGPEEIRGVGEQLEGIEDPEALIAELLAAMET